MRSCAGSALRGGNQREKLYHNSVFKEKLAKTSRSGTAAGVETVEHHHLVGIITWAPSGTVGRFKKIMAESNEKNTGGGADCTKCGLPISRPGTVTAWIFKTSYCACESVLPDAAFEFREDSDQADLPLLGNRYKVMSPIGRGGVANVYKVQDSVNTNILAAKVMLTELALNDLAVKRFQKETDVLADLSHKNLCKIHGYAMDRNGVPYLIMDYIDGPNLEEMIKNDGPLDSEVNRAANLFLQICAGLMYVHDHGIIHRDLKPSNVIVSSQPGSRKDHATVIDFGFAKNVDGSRDSRLTSTGEAFGSPCYMSPEHCLGKELDVRSDIYSFGCLMYQAMCGKPPVEGENALATVAKQVQGDVVSLRKVNPNVPKNLNNVIMQCLQKDPEMRYQTVDEIERDLLRVLSGKHVASQLKDKGSDNHRSANSPHILLNRWVAISAIVILVLGSGLIGAWLASNSASQPANIQTAKPETTQTATPATPPRPHYVASPPRPAVTPHHVEATPHLTPPRPVVHAPTVNPTIVKATPHIEKPMPPRPQAKIDDLPKKHQNRMEKARLAKKQAEQDREKWLKWLETQKLRKGN